jgi:hypothetical protein
MGFALPLSEKVPYATTLTLVVQVLLISVSPQQKERDSVISLSHVKVCWTVKPAQTVLRVRFVLLILAALEMSVLVLVCMVVCLVCKMTLCLMFTTT